MKANPRMAGAAALVVAGGVAGLLWYAQQPDGIENTASISSDMDLTQSTVPRPVVVAPTESATKTARNPASRTKPTVVGTTDQANQTEPSMAKLTGPARQSFLEGDERVSLALSKADPDAPRIDVVRIDAEGAAIIAGRGKPGTDVDILIGDEVVATVAVESSGSFAAVLWTPLAAGSRTIRLQTRIGERVIKGPEEVTVLVPGGGTSERPLVVISEPDRPTRVVQRPSSLPLRIGFSLDVIDYDDRGRVVFSGFAKGGAWVRIRLNADVMGKVRARDTGQWTITSRTGVPAGRYTIHLEELDEQARITRRAAFPFERANPDELVFADGEMVVQPGNNLWNIAKANYGSGFKYTVIYSANAGKISDPDLIYPGQVFNLPGD